MKNLRCPVALALASLLAPVTHAATTVYDVPSTAITYGNRYQYDPIATPAQTLASWAAASSFQSNASGSPLNAVTWYIRVDAYMVTDPTDPFYNPGNNPLPAGSGLDLELWTNNGSTNNPGALVASLGSVSLAGLDYTAGYTAFSLNSLSVALSPTTFYWVVGKANATLPNGTIELGVYANVPPFSTTPGPADPTLGALLSTDGGSSWTGGQTGGSGYFVAGQVTVPETSSTLALSVAGLALAALARRRRLG